MIQLFNKTASLNLRGLCIILYSPITVGHDSDTDTVVFLGIWNEGRLAEISTIRQGAHIDSSLRLLFY